MIIYLAAVAVGIVWIIYEQKKLSEKLDRVLKSPLPYATVEKPKEKIKGKVTVLSDWERRKSD